MLADDVIWAAHRLSGDGAGEVVRLEDIELALPVDEEMRLPGLLRSLVDLGVLEECRDGEYLLCQ